MIWVKQRIFSDLGMTLAGAENGKLSQIASNSASTAKDAHLLWKERSCSKSLPG